MAKRDINLFRAAGGERAKASKRSPVSIMLVVGLVVIVAALGVAAYFNMKVNTAKTDYEKKLKIQTNYQRTINSNEINSLSEMYKTVLGDIESTSAINEYVETRSALYPAATEGEIAAIKETILNNPLGEAFSLNFPEDEEDQSSFTPRPYEEIRASFYSDEAEDFADKELFYYALEKLAKKQEEDEEVNVWYDYYRCYFVTFFTGGDGLGISRLVSTLASGGGTMEGNVPFCSFEMDNDVYDDGVYVPAKWHTFVYNETTYNILLLPMKSVVERAFDILDAHAAALVEQHDWQGQTELAEYGVDNIEFSNRELKFKLILPFDGSLSGFMNEFDASYFFDVDTSVIRPGGEMVEGGISYAITLKYKNRPEFENPEED